MEKNKYPELAEKIIIPQDKSGHIESHQKINDMLWEINNFDQRVVLRFGEVIKIIEKQDISTQREFQILSQNISSSIRHYNEQISSLKTLIETIPSQTFEKEILSFNDVVATETETTMYLWEFMAKYKGEYMCTVVVNNIDTNANVKKYIIPKTRYFRDKIVFTVSLSSKWWLATCEFCLDVLIHKIH